MLIEDLITMITEKAMMTDEVFIAIDEEDGIDIVDIEYNDITRTLFIIGKGE